MKCKTLICRDEAHKSCCVAVQTIQQQKCEICQRQTQLHRLPFKTDASTLLGKCNLKQHTQHVRSLVLVCSGMCVCTLIGVCKVRGHWQTH